MVLMIKITRRLASASLVLGLLPLLHGCGSGDQTADTSANATGNGVAAAGNAAPADANAAPAAGGGAAKEFAPAKYDASVMMPGKPAEFGGDAKSDMWSSTIDNNTYMFGYKDSDNPEKDAADAAVQPGSKVTAGPTKTTVDGLPATDYTIVGNSGSGYTRTIIVKKRVYMLMTAGAKEGQFAPNSKEFLDSFKLAAAK